MRSRGGDFAISPVTTVQLFQGLAKSVAPPLFWENTPIFLTVVELTLTNDSMWQLQQPTSALCDSAICCSCNVFSYYFEASLQYAVLDSGCVTTRVKLRKRENSADSRSIWASLFNVKWRVYIGLSPEGQVIAHTGWFVTSEPIRQQGSVITHKLLWQVLHCGLAVITCATLQLLRQVISFLSSSYTAQLLNNGFRVSGLRPALEWWLETRQWNKLLVAIKAGDARYMTNNDNHAMLKGKLRNKPTHQLRPKTMFSVTQPTPLFDQALW